MFALSFKSRNFSIFLNLYFTIHFNSCGSYKHTNAKRTKSSIYINPKPGYDFIRRPEPDDLIWPQMRHIPWITTIVDINKNSFQIYFCIRLNFRLTEQAVELFNLNRSFEKLKSMLNHNLQNSTPKKSFSQYTKYMSRLTKDSFQSL